MAHFAPCKKTATTSDFVEMFMNYVVRLHGLPDSVVSDRGSIFTSKFWRGLARHLGVKGKLSMAFHPQTDGQTERMNQTLEQYLRMYCNYQQDDWYSHLSLAEFAYNNSFQSTIKCSPFYANYGFHPRFQVNLGSQSTADDVP